MNEPKLLQVPTGHCAPAPWANRADLNLTPEFLADIKNRGVRQSLEVRPVEGKKDRYEIIAGIRRWTAASKAKLPTVPVLVVTVNDQEGREGRLIENLHREGLTALDEAEQYQEALKTGDYGTGSAAVETLAAKVGKSRALVYARLRLLKLNPVVRKAVAAGEMEQSVAELVATIPDAKGQELAVKEIAKGVERWNSATGRHEREPLSFRSVKKLIEENFRRSLGAAPFKTDKVYEGVIEGRTGKGCQLVDCGTCTVCPRRSGNFPDLTKGTDPNLCTDVACFDAKADAEWALRVAAAEKQDQRVIEAKAWEKLQYGSPRLVRLDDSIWTGNDRKPVATLCAKALKAGELKPALVRDNEGDIFEVVSEADAKKFGGIKEQSHSNGSSGQSKADKAREAKKKLRVEVAKQAVPLLLAGFKKVKELDWWQHLSDAAFNHTSIDAHASIAKRRGLCKTQGEAREALQEWIGGKERTAEELRDITLELLIFAHHGVGTWNTSWAGEFEAACELAGVDLDKLEKQIAAEKSKPTPPAKAAKVKTKARK